MSHDTAATKLVHKLDKLLHPGVKEGHKYHEGVGDTTSPRRSVDVTNDDRQGVGMGYGAAEGIDTRDNQYEHDLKQELGQRGPLAETRAGVGQSYAVDGGIGEGTNTVDGKFEKHVKEEMSTGLAAQTAAESNAHHTSSTNTHAAGASNTFNNYSMNKDSHTHSDPDAITAVGATSSSGAATTHTHNNTGVVGGGKDRIGSTASSYPISGDQNAHLTPGRRESAVESALAAGHSDPARAGQSGQHSTYIANILDPNAGRNAST